MKKLIKKISDGVKEIIRFNQWGQTLGQEANHLASMVEAWHEGICQSILIIGHKFLRRRKLSYGKLLLLD